LLLEAVSGCYGYLGIKIASAETYNETVKGYN
jgi:hypothetical protein